MTMMTMSSRVDSLVLVAAGSSTRMGGGIKKEYLPMDAGTVLSCAARSFLEAAPIAVVAVTYPAQTDEDSDEKARNACRKALFADPAVAASGADFLFVSGGATRQQSVLYALEAIQDWYADHLDASEHEDPLVCIHDGARPFIKSETILAALEAATENGAAVPGLQPVDTQNEVDADGHISRHLVRSQLAAVQTPQVFRFFPLVQAHRTARLEQKECTDDTEIWDSYVNGVLEDSDGHVYGAVKVIPGDIENKKITYSSDLASLAPYATSGDGAQGGASASDNARSALRVLPCIRTGLGYDKHRLVAGRRLMLGGVELPADKGEDGHSDGDVLLHAITDAVLGAAGLGDIGSYFPPEEAQWKDADSKTLLAQCWKDVQAAGWQLGNLDCVLVLEKPKFLPYRDAVCASIATVLGCDRTRVFVKAKTGEKLGDVGEGRCIEAFATCLLVKGDAFGR